MIHEQIAANLVHLAPGAQWHIDGPIGKGRKCEIFKLTNDQQTHTLALKLYRSDQVTGSGPEKQFAALHRFTNDATPKLNVAMPRAHAFWPELNAILMDWIDAPRLRTVLWRNLLSQKTRNTSVIKAAQWLRHFHDTSETGSKAINAHALLAILNKRIEKSDAGQNLMATAPLFRKCLEKLHQLSDDPRLIAPHATLHGDFTPTNILMDGEQPIGIDIWGVRNGPIYEDIARMLTYLAIDSPFVLDQRPFHDGKQISRLFSLFLEGYGQDLITAESPALWYILLYQQLRRWIVFEDKARSKPSRVKAKLQLNRIRPLCKNSYSQLTSLLR
jgi:aminoglycoside phosphotransferase (APT) family kinase protein